MHAADEWFVRDNSRFLHAPRSLSVRAKYELDVTEWIAYGEKTARKRGNQRLCGRLYSLMNSSLGGQPQHGKSHIEGAVECQK